MGDCKIDTSSLTTQYRLDQYNNLFKKYPESKCTENEMSEIVKNFYQSYKEYPINMIGCPDRDKAFIISDDCNSFKYLPKDYYPGKEDDDSKYSDCAITGGDCDEILKEIDNKRLKHTIESSLDSCNDQYGKCSVYDVNDIKYTQTIKLDYIIYAGFIIMFTCCLFFIIIIIILFY